MKKKLAAVLMASAIVFGMSGCGSKDTSAPAESASVQESSAAQEETTQSNETMTDTQAKTDAAILAVSFGTSYNDSRDITIGAIENAIDEAFPEYEVRRAFTSQIIIEVLKEREGLEIDNVEEALDRAAADGIRELYVQPTHLMNGFEYMDLERSLTDYLDKFDKIVLGAPMLTSDADFDTVVKAITKKTADYDDGKTAICFMGHGTEADSNAVYAKLQDKLTDAGYANYYIGTVEAEPTIDDVVEALKANGGYERVVLEPLMVVAGDHANNDMAGDEEDSWKSILENEGFEVTCIIEGLGQIEEIQDLYVEHLRSAIESGAAFEGTDSDSDEGDKTASGELSEGVYSIEVESSSSMFNIVNALLTVDAHGGMSAVLTLSGTGYEKLYMGTGEEALAAKEEDFIPYVEDGEGAYRYTVPVEALDQPIDCAAFSKKKQEWYDRQITFVSATADLCNQVSAVNSANDSSKLPVLENADGSYLAELDFAGGSGKAYINSPAVITFNGSEITAKVQWSSENYDYMIVDGEKYLPISTEGGSVFEIPVSALDEEIEVIGDTVAMSTPKEIEYTIKFHSDSLKPVE